MNDEIREMKIGMYSTDEILEFMTNGEGRDFMGRSMYDAILDYITNLQKENEKLKRENVDLCAYLLFKNRRIPSALTKNRKIQELLEIPTYEDYKSRVEKTTEKLSFIDEALENDTLNVPLCIAKINSALNILQNGSDEK